MRPYSLTVATTKAQVLALLIISHKQRHYLKKKKNVGAIKKPYYKSADLCL